MHCLRLDKEEKERKKASKKEKRTKERKEGKRKEERKKERKKPMLYLDFMHYFLTFVFVILTLKRVKPVSSSNPFNLQKYFRWKIILKRH